MRICPSCSRLLGDDDSACPHCTPSDVSPTQPVPHPGGDSRDPRGDSRTRTRILPGEVVAGRYRVIEFLGRGGMGEVYRAYDLVVGETVALKFLARGLEDDPREIESLRTELRVARRVSHPNVCRVYDISDAGGVPFLTMEFVSGEDLASLLRRIRRLPPEKAVSVARQIGEGLLAIHDQGLVHRDLKPANIMLDGNGQVRITDFGLALVRHEHAEAPGIAGTLEYIAPETLARGEVTERSDLYSLGLVLHEVFTGERALRLADGRASLAGRRAGAHLDPRVAREIERCLATDPARRPASVSEVLAGLPDGDQVQDMLRQGRTPLPEQVARAAQRGLEPVWAWTCALFVLATMVGLAWSGGLGRVVASVPLPDPPAALALRVRDHLDHLGVPRPRVDDARGFLYARDRVEHIAATDASRDRWARLALERPAVVRFWYRASETPLVPWGPRQRLTPDDPPPLEPGMVHVELDPQGRLLQLEAVSPPAAWTAAEPFDWGRLFVAAGLDSADFRVVEPVDPAPVPADTRVAWDGTDAARPGVPLHVEAASLHGRPVAFQLMAGPVGRRAGHTGDAAPGSVALVRTLLLVGSFLVAAALARRHVRSGRGDRRRAWRVASFMMGVRLAIWVLSVHWAASGLAGQFALALAWSLYDFAFARVFYLAVEPYVRRYWPRMLTTWVRLVDGARLDAAVGRDLLVGSAFGALLQWATVAHRYAPLLLGEAPGRPDNVGFVEPTLAVLLGTRAQSAQALELFRSATLQTMSFVVVLVLARRLVRRPELAIAIGLCAFVPLAMPVGTHLGLDVVTAFLCVAGAAFVALRFGLVAAITGLTVHALLQSTPLQPGLTHWSSPGSLLQFGFVALIVAWGLRASTSRPAPRGLPA